MTTAVTKESLAARIAELESGPRSLKEGYTLAAYKMLLATMEAEQGWISVSERMPEEGGRYWCYVEEQNSLGKSHYQWNCSWNGDVWSDKALTGRVTHWMPLPAAPVK